MTKTVTLLTCSDFPSLSKDEAQLPKALLELGCEAKIQVWDSWQPQRNEVAVVRSVWDYHKRHREFLTTLEKAMSVGAHIWNNYATIRWNAHKSYLLDLEKLGVPIVPTVLCFYADTSNLAPIPEVERYVVKPAVSASAHHTKVVERPNVEASLAETLELNPDGVLLQPFIEEIQTEGEWSVVFLNGQYSHAVLKTPKKGDFRVQEDYGGKSKHLDPPELVLMTAKKAVDCVQEDLLYARVDGVVRNNVFYLMELELIEPSLLFLGDQTLVSAFARAISKRL